MSHIDELIDQLCPDGVPFVPMWKLTTWDKRFNSVERFKQSRVEKYKYLLAKELTPLVVEHGDVKILTTNESNLWTSEDLVDGPVYDAEIIAIPWGGNAVVQYFSGRFVTSDNRIAVVNNPNQLNVKFLYYFIFNNIGTLASFYRGSGIKHPSMAKVLDWSIPVPPLEVQREIVRILDQFTALEAELEAELEARRHQYEYYRDEALRFGDDVRSVPLGDVIHELRTGLNPRQNFKLNTPGATNHYITVRELAGFNILPTDKTDLVNDQGLVRIQDRSRLQVGDVLFSGTGTIGRTALVEEEPTSWNIKEGIYALTPKRDLISARFLIHLLRSSVIRQRILGTAAGSTVASVSMASLRRVLLPVPSMDEQERITALLDNFETLTNDLSIGLPAELAARRKQYEYYRDQLLTFEEAPA